MNRRSESAVTAHRRRMADKGLARLELRVAREDVPLIRQVAAALSDPRRRLQARRVIEDRLAPEPTLGLKALLAAAPAELELDRDLDLGRDVDL